MQKSISKILPDGSLSVLNHDFMRKYFTKRLRVFFQDAQSLVKIAIDDQSGHFYKKTIRYVLTIFTGDQTTKKYIRANIPSLDTTWEIDASFEASDKLYRNGFNKPPFEVYRPLAKDHALRFFLYEEHSGKTLEHFIKLRPANLKYFFEQTALWLTKLTNLGAVCGQQKKISREKQEIRWFLNNFRSYLPSYEKVFEQAFNDLWKIRLSLAPYLNRRLIHGDFQPKNILITRRPQSVCAIDFGNSWQYDSASDVGQFCAITLSLSHHHIASSLILRKMVDVFLNVYLNNLSHSDHSLRKKINFFTAWWLLQNAAFQITQIKTAQEKRHFSIFSLDLARKIMRAAKL